MDKMYFIRKRLTDERKTDIKVKAQPIFMPIKHSVVLIVNFVKILLGLCLVVCGIVMLVLPGQGIITILVGLSLLPFPGKHKIEQFLLARKSVRYSLNWIRSKANKAPFMFDET